MYSVFVFKLEKNIFAFELKYGKATRWDVLTFNPKICILTQAADEYQLKVYVNLLDRNYMYFNL